MLKPSRRQFLRFGIGTAVSPQVATAEQAGSWVNAISAKISQWQAARLRSREKMAILSAFHEVTKGVIPIGFIPGSYDVELTECGDERLEVYKGIINLTLKGTKRKLEIRPHYLRGSDFFSKFDPDRAKSSIQWQIEYNYQYAIRRGWVFGQLDPKYPDDFFSRGVPALPYTRPRNLPPMVAKRPSPRVGEVVDDSGYLTVSSTANDTVLASHQSPVLIPGETPLAWGERRNEAYRLVLAAARFRLDRMNATA